MHTVVIDGKEFTKVSQVAKELGYARDYVGQLCRNGAVPAHLIGRTWYVSKDSVSEHRVVKKRAVRAHAKKQAQQILEEYKSTAKNYQKSFKNIDISYENDETSLIPNVRKVVVTSVTPRFSPPHVEELSDTLLVENRGKKVIMSGDLSVVDVTDGEFDEATTILTPQILSVPPEEPTSFEKNTASRAQRSQNHDIEVDSESDFDTDVPIQTAQPLTFAEKLAVVPDSSENEEAIRAPEPVTSSTRVSLHLHVWHFVSLALMFLVLGLFCTNLIGAHRIEYNASDPVRAKNLITAVPVHDTYALILEFFQN